MEEPNKEGVVVGAEVLVAVLVVGNKELLLLENKEVVVVVVLAGVPKDNVFVVLAAGVKELPKSGVVEGAAPAVAVPPNRRFVC